MPTETFAVLRHAVLNALIDDGEDLCGSRHVVPMKLSMSKIQNDSDRVDTHFFLASNESESWLKTSMFIGEPSERVVPTIGCD